MHIGELAQKEGVSVQTVRYYERYGLLRKPERNPSRYRVYGERDVQMLRFILYAKTLGFSLDEIKNILRLREQKECPCGEVLKIADRRLHELVEQIAQLEKFHAELARPLKAWKMGPQQAPSGDAICVLIERTMRESERSSNPRARSKKP